MVVWIHYGAPRPTTGTCRLMRWERRVTVYDHVRFESGWRRYRPESMVDNRFPSPEDSVRFAAGLLLQTAEGCVRSRAKKPTS
jgi:hypothetical protein